MKYLSFLILLIFPFLGFSKMAIKKVNPIESNCQEIHSTWIKQAFILTKNSVGFSAPISARAYAYFSIAMYESNVELTKNLQSISNQLNGYHRLTFKSKNKKLPWGAFHKKDQKLKIYENELPQGNWIGIKLKGEVPFTTDAFGCRVLFEQENRKMIKEVDGCSGHASQSSPILYYGLGTATRLKKATLLLPNGQTFEFNDLKANSLYEITTSGKIEIKN